jgi:hypothetical protein
MDELPVYYNSLSEEKKKEEVVSLLYRGCKAKWVSEEADKFGIKFLSEFYKEIEKGETL